MSDSIGDFVVGCSDVEKDWEVIERILPAGWEAAAKETGAMMRTRGFDSPSTLLRVLLIHLADGCSLRETAVRARTGNLAMVSDVALLNRLRGCGEWFRWMGKGLIRHLSGTTTDIFPGKRVRLVDASVICEPRATGSTWRLHYMIDLSTLRCEQAQITAPSDGETLARFEVALGDILMADRGLASRRGIRHVVDRGGDVVVRMNLVAIPLEARDEKGTPFNLLPALRQLRVGEARDWQAQVRDTQGTIPVRVCALKKSVEQTRKAQEKVRQQAAKDGRTPQPETLEAAGYIMILTTLTEPSATAILELYRHRWQIELAFKRLKSLLHLGHLKKTDPEGAKAWLQGKLLVAALIEMLIAVGERFSPWGYFSLQATGTALPVA